MNNLIEGKIIEFVKNNDIINNNDNIILNKLFCLLFDKFPNIYFTYLKHDSDKLVKFIYEAYKDAYHIYTTDNYEGLNKENSEKIEKCHSHIWIINDKSAILSISDDKFIKIYHSNDNDEWCENLIREINDNCFIEKSPNKFNIIVKEGMHLSLKTVEPIIRNTDVNLMYNDDFSLIHNKIVSFLQNDDTGIVILHGKQGTGKTSYIRHLIYNNINKKIIYVTPDMMKCLSSPDIIPFMIENKDSILILENCEELLRSRKGKDTVNSGLINILNMSDGLLGDLLHVKFICTFNEGMKDIDMALQRKGRLVVRYEFKSLAKEKVKILNDKFNLKIPDANITDMTLAEAFNFNDTDYTQYNNKIGLI